MIRTRHMIRLGHDRFLISIRKATAWRAEARGDAQWHIAVQLWVHHKRALN